MSVAALKGRLRDDLKAAMRERDTGTVALLRALAAALDNAEAVPLDAVWEDDAVRIRRDRPTEVARRQLGPADIAAVLDHEIGERLAAAAEYDARGRPDEAERSRKEAVRIDGYR